MLRREGMQGVARVRSMRGVSTSHGRWASWHRRGAGTPEGLERRQFKSGTASGLCGSLRRDARQWASTTPPFVRSYGGLRATVPVCDEKDGGDAEFDELMDGIADYDAAEEAVVQEVRTVSEDQITPVMAASMVDKLVQGSSAQILQQEVVGYDFSRIQVTPAFLHVMACTKITTFLIVSNLDFMGAHPADKRAKAELHYARLGLPGSVNRALELIAGPYCRDHETIVMSCLRFRSSLENRMYLLQRLTQMVEQAKLAVGYHERYPASDPHKENLAFGDLESATQYLKDNVHFSNNGEVAQVMERYMMLEQEAIENEVSTSFRKQVLDDTKAFKKERKLYVKEMQDLAGELDKASSTQDFLETLR
ncbi:hypothetical protein FVE85_2395 [Porphyridium purpureum]|uniref:Small ribosomal subunit protein mS35 mitochondrial conserved domain-containing protein n=1 Tax=Porphyridium purpureum TaxID=35688 RepID=A0A5J4YZ29_PORPP|nr:hypothetical protein FVE85_2395 [Porphyridium purpureum]|eukprot:POR1429..scf209_3